jgi:polygalacturonase
MKFNYKEMKSLKTVLFLATATLFATCAISQTTSNTTGKTDMYSGIEFKMPRVNEPVIPKNQVSIVDFGAKSNGQVLCTKAIADAIDAVSKKGGGRVVIPRGIWLTGPITLKSNIELYTEPGALVVFSTDKDLYPLVETIFEGFSTVRCMSPLNGRNLENVAITGKGVFDGSGDVWRQVKKDKLTESQWKKLVASGGIVRADGMAWYPSQQFIDGEKMSEMNVPRKLKTKEEFMKIRDFLRPVLVSLVSCKKVLLDGPTFQNSPAWNIHPLMCEDLTIRNIVVRNPWYSQNGDGIDIESCKNVLLYDSSFDAGDDGICIKSGKDKEGRDRNMPTENLIIKNCIVFHGHGGVTVGSEMSGGVRNMHVSNCTFIGTDVGLRFKSNRGRGGVVENIYISNVEMMNIPAQAISFNLFYGGTSPTDDIEAVGDVKAPVALPVTEETPQFKNIFIKNVNCKGAFQGIVLQGLPEMNLKNVQLENILIESDNGMVCSDATGVKIKNLTLITKKSTVADFKNTQDVSIDGLFTRSGVAPVVQVSGALTKSVVLKNTGIINPEKQLIVGKEVPPNAIQMVK